MNARQRREVVNNLNDYDIKRCLTNSWKLFEESHISELSEETSSALLELSLEEAAKAVIIYNRLHDASELDETSLAELDKILINAFRRHKVKVETVKAIVRTVIEEPQDKEEALGVARELVRSASRGFSPEKRKSVREKGSLLDDPEALDAMFKAADQVIGILDGVDAEDITELKNKALYVNLSEDGKGLERPMSPNKRLKFSLRIITFAIIRIAYKSLDDRVSVDRISKRFGEIIESSVG